MTRTRGYGFELCWLLLIILIFGSTPVRTAIIAFNWEDIAFDCESSNGWCIP